MSEVSPAYSLTSYIHDSLFRPGPDFTAQEIADCGVRASVAAPYMTQRLYIGGIIDGHPAYQTLAKSQKNGTFYLSTVFEEEGGVYLRDRITPTSPDASLVVVESTLFMQAIRHIQQQRQQAQ